MALLVTVTTACDRHEAAWEKARQTDTVSAYQAYLDDYGDTPQAADARARIKELERAAAWAAAEQADTVDAYRAFAERYPDSRQAAQAQARLAALERARAWQALSTTTDLEALTAFDERYAGEPEAEQARRRIAELAAEQEQAQARLAEERQREARATLTHRVQLAAYRSADDAAKGIGRLEQQLASTLAGIALESLPSGRMHAVRTEPMPESEARALCAELKQAGQDCFVVRR